MSIRANDSDSDSSTDIDEISCFGCLFYKFRGCFRKRRAPNSNLSVHAVDSESPTSEPHLNQSTVATIDPSEYESSSVRLSSVEPEVLSRRKKSSRVTLDALERALKLYETKHKNIIQCTGPMSGKYSACQSSILLSDPSKKSKTDIRNKLEATNSKLEKNKKLNKCADKEKYTSNQLDDEEENNICFDVETVSMDTNASYIEFHNRKKVSIDDNNRGKSKK